ncbi:hypothetical protein Tco_0333574 [Tanacetum coccineum]
MFKNGVRVEGSNEVFGNDDREDIEEVRSSKNEDLTNNNEPKGDEVNREESVKETNIKDSMDKESSPVIGKSYASVVQKNNQKLDTSLCFRPTVIKEDRSEFVVFDEELVAKGSNKWKLTVYRHFVGCSMSENALRMKNMPLEAWTKDGISALASSLGRPLRMDNVTAQACITGRGRA